MIGLSFAPAFLKRLTSAPPSNTKILFNPSSATLIKIAKNVNEQLIGNYRNLCCIVSR